jgi:restriction system protein
VGWYADLSAGSCRSPRGQEVLAKHPDRVDLGVLVQFEEFIEFKSRSRRIGQAGPGTPGDSEATPRETVAAAVEEANAAVAAEVLDRVGYGGARGSAKHIGRSGDNGLDGVIRQDPLGLYRIYVQAKCYAADRPVRRPEIQEFVGALHGAQADRDVFITTSRFILDAKDYADRVDARLVLIDGRMLARLMVDLNIGVQDRERYVIKRIDEDFFEEVS